MGPYCNFCQRRCFVHFPTNAPQSAIDAWGPGSWILATCPTGQKADADGRGGWSYDAIRAEVARRGEEMAAEGAADANDRTSSVPEGEPIRRDFDVTRAVRVAALRAERARLCRRLAQTQDELLMLLRPIPPSIPEPTDPLCAAPLCPACGHVMSLLSGILSGMGQCTTDGCRRRGLAFDPATTDGRDPAKFQRLTEAENAAELKG